MEVRIVVVPPGEAPAWVRECWVGLVLPLDDGESGARSVRTCGVLTGPKTLLQAFWHLLTGRFVRQHVYIIDALEAIEILADHAPDAAEWWEGSAYVQPGRKFAFPAEVCEEL
jgi:hypothetical protein